MTGPGSTACPSYDWIRRDIESARISPADLSKTTIRFGNLGNIRRIGALLEQMAQRNPSSAIAADTDTLDGQDSARARQPPRGVLLKRWGWFLNG
jgi:hypothetical protein